MSMNISSNFVFVQTHLSALIYNLRILLEIPILVLLGLRQGVSGAALLLKAPGEFISLHVIASRHGSRSPPPIFKARNFAPLCVFLLIHFSSDSLAPLSPFITLIITLGSHR